MCQDYGENRDGIKLLEQENKCEICDVGNCSIKTNLASILLNAKNNVPNVTRVIDSRYVA